jgi:hypothetical protein
MAEMVVRIEGGVALTDTSGTAASVVSAGGVNSLVTTGGVATSQTSLNAVTAAATGSTASYGTSYGLWTVFSVSTGTLTGTVHLEVSADGTSWVDVASGTVPAAGTFQSTFTIAARYARARLDTVTGTGTITSKLVAA